MLVIILDFLDFLVFPYVYSRAVACVRVCARFGSKTPAAVTVGQEMSERSFKARPQCGLCNAVSNVFRRLLCVGPSRRGSSESYYQQLDPVETYDREHEEPQTPVSAPSSPFPVRVHCKSISPRRLECELDKVSRLDSFSASLT